jgi:hypothetical protein
VSSTLHKEPSVLPQFISFRRRNFLYGKKESCLQDSPPAAGRGSDILPLRRSAIIAFYHMVKKRLRHFNLRPSGEGLSYKTKKV